MVEQLAGPTNCIAFRIFIGHALSLSPKQNDIVLGCMKVDHPQKQTIIHIYIYIHTHCIKVNSIAIWGITCFCTWACLHTYGVHRSRLSMFFLYSLDSFSASRSVLALSITSSDTTPIQVAASRRVTVASYSKCLLAIWWRPTANQRRLGAHSARGNGARDCF